jgi:cytochrome P450
MLLGKPWRHESGPLEDEIRWAPHLLAAHCGHFSLRHAFKMTPLDSPFEDNVPLTEKGPLRTLEQLPGPRALPLVGNLLSIPLNRAHQALESWARIHGPLYRCMMGPAKVLVVADQVILNSVLKRRPDTFRRDSRLTELLEEMGMPQGIFYAEGDAWLRQRRMIMSGLSPNMLRMFFPEMRRITMVLRKRWHVAADQNLEIELLADLMRYTVDNLVSMAFGTESNTLEGGEDVIQKHIEVVFKAFHQRMVSLIPWWRWIQRPVDRELSRSLKRVHSEIERFVSLSRARLEANPQLRENPENILDTIVASVDRPGSGLNETDVVGNVFSLLMAGEDTTASTLAWTIHLLSLNPDALARAKEEVAHKIPDVEQVTIDQINSLEFLDACVHEAMRLKPVGIIHPIEALENTVVGDVEIEKGQLIWGLVRHDSVSADHFKEPLAFRPERWLDDPGPDGPASTAKRISQPFGAGARACPGRYMALLEIKMVGAMLLKDFDLVAALPSGGGMAEEEIKLLMAPVGLKMRLTKKPVPGAGTGAASRMDGRL